MAHKHGTDLGGINSVARIKERCRIDPITGCWHWALSLSDGLPHMHVHCPETGKVVKMKGRRASLTLRGGKLLPSGWVAFRAPHCDSADCVNPDHCLAGPPSEYGKAMQELGLWRDKPNRIAANLQINRRRRKLTMEQAREIRASSLSTPALAKVYGVTKTTVRDIQLGKRYRDAARGASVFNLGAV